MGNEKGTYRNSTGLAAAIKEKHTLKGKRVGLVITGGNVDHDVFGRVLLD